jgi:uncharacterized protein (TIGR03066 family)
MKPLFAAAVALALLAPALLKADEPKKEDKQTEESTKKIVGTWEITKASEEMAVGALVTFDKDGKLLIKITINGQEQKIEGKWKLEKGKLITESMGNEDTDTIKKLTDDAMELEDKDGKATVLKKKK